MDYKLEFRKALNAALRLDKALEQHDANNNEVTYEELIRNSFERKIKLIEALKGVAE